MNNTPLVDKNLEKLYKDSGINPENNREKLIFVFCLENNVLSSISSVEPIVKLNTDMIELFENRLIDLEKTKKTEEGFGYSTDSTIKDIDETIINKSSFEGKLIESQQKLTGLKNLLAEIQLIKATLTE